ncbi:SAM-dependent methyltransferase [Paracoccus bogoriensis]|uniref:SAM-dependent methyltransferase n=1 Tax=Paracoccus bogoriensis TaxID=242065 RepID=UPI0031BA513C
MRLKSGDPGVFGRLAEELEAARAAGIPVEIVPGVIAACAAAATLGRRLSERGQTDRLMLATATCRPGDPEPDWPAMLREGTTLAIYMGLRRAGPLVQALAGAGVPLSLEAEVVAAASTARERVLRCRLGDLPGALARAGIAEAAVIFLRWPKAASPAPAKGPRAA